ncbi:hypothetical protein OJAV_G00132450 [Oryzias javanicus]|uniref:Uncharacterized protein n=1 Tax=Oryzias javanicus TaxID=123683 RepID=A0A437CQI6_ORYJA|nr:hypothetical protein OJAV_G00132450 [Oryzias javanicus]
MAASQRRLLDASSPPPSRVSELECEPGVRTVSSGSRGSSTSGERIAAPVQLADEKQPVPAQVPQSLSGSSVSFLRSSCVEKFALDPAGVRGWEQPVCQTHLLLELFQQWTRSP